MKKLKFLSTQNALPVLLLLVCIPISRAAPSYEIVRGNKPLADLVIDSFLPTPTLSTGLVTGHCTSGKNGMMINLQDIKPDQSGKFEARVPIARIDPKFEITGVDALGEIENETVTLVLKQEPLPKATATPNSPFPKISEKPNSSANHFSMGLMTSLISYRETGIPNLNETALTLKLNSARTLSARWEASGGGYATLFTLAPTLKPSARFFGLNLRAGYNPNWFAEPDNRLMLNAGFYFTTMQVSGNAYGFQNMSGPQFYPDFIHRFGNGNSLSAYLKYSLVSKSWTSFKSGSREIAFGSGYTWMLKNQHMLSAGLDLAILSLNLEQAGQSIAISSSSYSLSATYGF